MHFDFTPPVDWVSEDTECVQVGISLVGSGWLIDPDHDACGLVVTEGGGV